MLGFITSGMAVSHLLIVPLTIYLIAVYDWRMALQMLGLGMAFFLAPLCFVFIRSRPEELGLRPYGEAKTSEPGSSGQPPGSRPEGDKGVAFLKERIFWQLTLPYFFAVLPMSA